MSSSLAPDVVALSNTGTLPTPVGQPAGTDRSPKKLLRVSKNVEEEEPSVPYQALPVTGGAVITHNLTPALPVMELGELSQKVGGCLGLWVAT